MIDANVNRTGNRPAEHGDAGMMILLTVNGRWPREEERRELG